MTARELQDILLDLEIRQGNTEVCVRGSMDIFEVLSPKNRKKMVEELCCFLHDASESMEPEKKENTDN